MTNDLSCVSVKTWDAFLIKMMVLDSAKSLDITMAYIAICLGHDLSIGEKVLITNTYNKANKR
jgi:hypothetical protein